MHVIGTQTQRMNANSSTWLSSRESFAWIELCLKFSCLVSSHSRQQMNKFLFEGKTHSLAHENSYTHSNDTQQQARTHVLSMNVCAYVHRNSNCCQSARQTKLLERIKETIECGKRINKLCDDQFFFSASFDAFDTFDYQSFAVQSVAKLKLKRNGK